MMPMHAELRYTGHRKPLFSQTSRLAELRTASVLYTLFGLHNQPKENRNAAPAAGHGASVLTARLLQDAQPR